MTRVPTVIALDVGHSAVKVLVQPSGPFDLRDRKKLIFPSVVSPAIQIAEESAARSAALETVTVGGRNYFFGRTAILQGGAEVETGMSESWINDASHLALVEGALRKLSRLQPPVSTEDAVVVVGLPAKYYAKQKRNLIDVLHPLMPRASLKVLPQPLGPYFCRQLDDKGRDRTDRLPAEDCCAVIEVGHYTTDFALIKDGDWIQRGSDSCVGASMATSILQEAIEKRTNTSISLLDATAALESGKISMFGESIDLSAEISFATQVFSGEVIGCAERLWDREARSLTGVIVAGGGADLVYERVKARFKNIIPVEDARFGVALGFLRAGLAHANEEALKDSRQASAESAA